LPYGGIQNIESLQNLCGLTIIINRRFSVKTNFEKNIQKVRKFSPFLSLTLVMGKIKKGLVQSKKENSFGFLNPRKGNLEALFEELKLFHNKLNVVEEYAHI